MRASCGVRHALGHNGRPRPVPFPSPPRHPLPLLRPRPRPGCEFRNLTDPRRGQTGRFWSPTRTHARTDSCTHLTFRSSSHPSHRDHHHHHPVSPTSYRVSVVLTFHVCGAIHGSGQGEHTVDIDWIETLSGACAYWRRQSSLLLEPELVFGASWGTGMCLVRKRS